MDNELTLEELLAAITSDDADVRTRAWSAAGQVGPAALEPLADVMATGALEVARAASRGMWAITHAAGAPGATGRAETVIALARLLGDERPVTVRREALWMLSEIAAGSAVAPMALLLSHDELQEDCRMALERIPGDASLAALQRGFEQAPESFKYNLAQSLRRTASRWMAIPARN